MILIALDGEVYQERPQGIYCMALESEPVVFESVEQAQARAAELLRNNHNYTKAEILTTLVETLTVERTVRMSWASV